MKKDPYIEYLISVYNSPAFVDEVGTGGIFGNIVACAVMITAPFEMAEVDDSKKLKHETIYRLAPELRNRVIYAIGISGVSEINKLRSTVKADLLAMKRAVNNLPVKPDALFIDGKYAPKLSIPIYRRVPTNYCIYWYA